MDYWEESRPYYLAVAGHVRDLVAGTAAEPAYRRLTARPGNIAAEVPLRRELAEVLAGRPERLAPVLAELDRAAAAIRIDYHHGPGYRPDAEPVDLALLREWAARRPHRPSGEPDVLVVISLRDSVGGSRVRNLLACLMALRDQTWPVAVTLVETDEQPRWREVVDPLVDRYLFLPYDGPFNKSWACNVGVANSAGNARYLCILDADILADRDFVARNRERLVADGHAHLPYVNMFSLDAAASHRAIRDRVAGGEPDVPLDVLRSLVLVRPPGACMWITRDAYDRVGGMDERFAGWGGEDDDLLARLELHGPVRRFTDPFLHLDHPRPPMVDDGGAPFNAHLEPLSWRAGYGYGRLSGPWQPDPEPSR
ncbi:galactosyltransferase-related protein [Actinophytocola sp.]|uniref:galactosyltransferase-related protein n=1 Tax=Actinophytocola sp. TaxID=1872138 RepID=UPI002DC01219|nr:galactosyltransferase-related protein [Actinophytocola sp.]